MSAVRIKKSGFTLVEILIVVIILGILAAIVIPQFTDASESAKKNSLVSQVQTIRSQVELFKSAHSSSAADKLFATTTTPALTWAELTSKTDVEGVVTAGAAYGPYLQAVPVNNLNGLSTVKVETTTIADEAAYSTTAVGFVYDKTAGKFWATNKAGTKIYNGTN